MRSGSDPRVLLHFHPDWPHLGSTVIEAMRRAGRYRSQFETGTSNGGLTAHIGGDRWQWESRLFNGRYDSRPADERPVYGSLDLGDRYGAAFRFGSSFLRLTAEASSRATFCYPDSVFDPPGVTGADGVARWITRMEGDDLDVLDRYVEAHVHGGLNLAADVECIVLDKCFRGTSVHDEATRIGVTVNFHPGFRVVTQELDPTYRGEEYSALAQLLGDELTPDMLGAAARSARYDPQALKRVWHLLARFGRDPESATAELS